MAFKGREFKEYNNGTATVIVRSREGYIAIHNKTDGSIIRESIGGGHTISSAFKEAKQLIKEHDSKHENLQPK